jgi:hypothetical protein
LGKRENIANKTKAILVIDAIYISFSSIFLANKNNRRRLKLTISNIITAIFSK